MFDDDSFSYHDVISDDSSLLLVNEPIHRKPKHKSTKEKNANIGRQLAVEFSKAERTRRIEEMIAFHKRENELYRKPCKTCGTLVKPALLKQHFDAYHPKK